MSRRDFVVVGAWMGWLSGCAAGLYVLLRQFEDSKASTQYLIEHRGEGVLQCIAGAIGASIAVTAFLHLARLRKVRLGPPGEQEKIGVGCYTLFLVWMAWALISTLVLK